MEVAVAIGTDPALTFSAIVPAPPDVEEFVVAGFLRQKPVELVKCETVDLEVPANAEIILEGYVNLDELRTEGPFGDHTGFYSLEDEYPVFHVTCMTHRKDPIYATTVVGKPPQEDAWMGKAVERIFLPLMKLTIPELVDINLPVEGVFHNLMIVSIRKSYPGQARKVMNAIWSLGQAMFTKCIIVVDEDVNVQDVADVTLKVLNNIDPERDIQFTMGPVDSLDHAARLANYGSKMGIDATRKWTTEGFGRPWPDEIVMDAKTRARGGWKMEGAGERVGDRVEEGAGKIVSLVVNSLISPVTKRSDLDFWATEGNTWRQRSVPSVEVSGLQPLRTVNQPHRSRTSDQHTARSRHPRRVLPSLLARLAQLLMRVPVLLDLFPFH